MRFAPLDDDALPATSSRAQILATLAEEARILLRQRVQQPTRHEWPLALCTLYPDTNVLPWSSDPASHPLWRQSALVPESASELTFWLASRLPLSSALRLHVLATTCPQKRMSVLVAAMRLLSDPERPIPITGPNTPALCVRWQDHALPQLVIDLTLPADASVPSPDGRSVPSHSVAPRYEDS